MNSIKLIVVSNSGLLDAIQDHFQKLPGYTLALATQNIAEAESYLARSDTQVALVDVGATAARPFLASLKAKKIPSLVVADTANEGFSLMGAGATHMVVRDVSIGENYFCRMMAIRITQLIQKTGVNSPRALKRPNATPVDKIVVIGSSTGGPEAVAQILKDLSVNVPPILITQHMPPVFTRMYAERLHGSCKVSVWEAQDGDALVNGLVLIAPGDLHMELARSGSGFCVRCLMGAAVSNQRPSVDVLFDSAARIMGLKSNRVLSIILTGMGSDGARGMLNLRQKGAHTLGQDEASCVVYGMPKAAYDCGAVETQLPLDKIAQRIVDFHK